MKLIFLGSGAAFTVGNNNYQSNMLLEHPNGHRLLIDCGSDARIALAERGISHQEIQHVFVSHLHSDHVGGLEWLAFSTKFDPECQQRPVLYINEAIANDLWNKVLSGGLSSLEETQATIASYFNVLPIAPSGKFKWEGIDISIFPTIHFWSNGHLMPTSGLLMNLDGQEVLITGDVQFVPDQMMGLYKKADIIFHDCETAQRKTRVHAHYTDLVQLPNEIKHKMWLYHYNPGPLPNACKDGFRGFVKKGQVFDFLDKSC